MQRYEVDAVGSCCSLHLITNKKTVCWDQIVWCVTLLYRGTITGEGFIMQDSDLHLWWYPAVWDPETPQQTLNSLFPQFWTQLWSADGLNY